MAPARIDSTIETPFEPLEIPTVDISCFLGDPNSLESKKVIDVVRSACRSTGFFQIVGHGVSKELQKTVFEGAKEFFKLPLETKKQYSAKGHRGYDVLASQSYEEGILPDLKEGFYTAKDIPEDDPRAKAGRFFMGPNVWPDSNIVPESIFREPQEQYHKELNTLAIHVLKLIERTLPYGEGIFDHFTSNDPVAIMRVLHYPPRRETEDKAQFGSSAHTDFGAITLLLQDESPGLEVRHPKTGEWVSVPPNTDAYVVNVGDMLSFWTKFEYISSVHRVINYNPWDRYSIVFFFDGNLDTELRALDGSENDIDDPLTVEKHMLRRMAESYGKHKK